MVKTERGDEAGIGERQEVKAVVDQVELAGPFEDLGDMKTLAHLRVDLRIFGIRPRHD